MSNITKQHCFRSRKSLFTGKKIPLKPLPVSGFRVGKVKKAKDWGLQREK